MQFYSALTHVPADFADSAVTIGKFDGVHSGHRRVIADLRSAAERAGLSSVVVTFDRNPLGVLHPETNPPPLMSNAQRREALEKTGVDATVMLSFDQSFSQLSPREFVQRVLVGTVHARVIVVGSDFRFGHDGLGDVALLTELGEEFGFAVQQIHQLTASNDRVVSSSWIRELLAEGRVDAASELLAQLPAIRAVVVQGEHRGRELGYPTANLAEDSEGFIPADGIYAAFVTVANRTYPAAVSIGDNPTFARVRAKQVEAHILDETIELYGVMIEVALVSFVRGMVKFDSVDQLVRQMGLDTQQIRELLRGRSTP